MGLHSIFQYTWGHGSVGMFVTGCEKWYLLGLKFNVLMLFPSPCIQFVGMTGIVDYTNYDDMKRAVSCCAVLNFLLFFENPGFIHHSIIGFELIVSFVYLQIKKLDDSEFRNAFSRAYVRVCHYICVICCDKSFIWFLVLLIYWLLFRWRSIVQGGATQGVLVVAHMAEVGAQAGAGVVAIVTEAGLL